MSVAERDPHSGHMTTGHEWNGIKELNTPVPRLVFLCLAVTGLFSLGYWLLMPAFPLVTTYTKGLLGFDDRMVVAAALKQADADRASWAQGVSTRSYAEIQADAKQMAHVRTAGRTLFQDNCAPCHGANATGGRSFPNLTTQAWLWGGSPDAIAETIRVGINATHRATRNSMMPAFGRDGVLKPNEIEDVVAYALSLSPTTASTAARERISAGKSVFVANCAVCHGPEGKGNIELGAPDLTDGHSIHGTDKGTLYTSVWGGLQGQMPSWEERLSPLERKILALYIVDLRKSGR